MNCLKCELRRAKWRSAIMVGLGKGLHEIADHLTKTYGENYYVTRVANQGFATFTIWRANKLGAFDPHEIYSLNTGA